MDIDKQINLGGQSSRSANVARNHPQADKWVPEAAKQGSAEATKEVEQIVNPGGQNVPNFQRTAANFDMTCKSAK